MPRLVVRMFISKNPKCHFSVHFKNNFFLEMKIFTYQKIIITFPYAT